MNYIDNVNYRIKEYFNVLEPKYPRWLNDYINTKEMLHQQYISITCGTIYSDLYKSDFFFFYFRPFDCRSTYYLAFYS